MSPAAATRSAAIPVTTSVSLDAAVQDREPVGAHDRHVHEAVDVDVADAREGTRAETTLTQRPQLGARAHQARRRRPARRVRRQPCRRPRPTSTPRRARPTRAPRAHRPRRGVCSDAADAVLEMRRRRDRRGRRRPRRRSASTSTPRGGSRGAGEHPAQRGAEPVRAPEVDLDATAADIGHGDGHVGEHITIAIAIDVARGDLIVPKRPPGSPARCHMRRGLVHLPRARPAGAPRPDPRSPGRRRRGPPVPSPSTSPTPTNTLRGPICAGDSTTIGTGRGHAPTSATTVSAPSTWAPPRSTGSRRRGAVDQQTSPCGGCRSGRRHRR